MAEEKILIQVDVDTEKMQRELSQAIEKVAALKDAQKTLRTAIEEGKDVNGEMAKKLVQVNAELEKNQRQVKSQTAIMQAATAAQLKENASLDEQRQLLNTAQKAYANLSGEAKELADQEGGLRDQIKKLNDQVKDQEQKMGDARRNVGNYTESIMKAADQLGAYKGAIEGIEGGATKASKGLDRMDKVAKGFKANPGVMVVFLIGSVLSAITDYLRENEEAMDGVSKVTAGIGGTIKSLEPLLKWLQKFLVDSLLWAIDKVTAALKATLGWLDKIAKKFGKDLNLAAAFEEGATAAREMTEEEKKAAEEAVKIEEEKNKKVAALREEMHKRTLSDMDREIYELQKKAEEELKTAKLTAKEKAEIQQYYADKIAGVRQKYADEEAKAAEEAQKKLDEEAKKAEEAELKRLAAKAKAREQFGLDPTKSPEEAELDLLQQAREQDLLNDEEYELAKTMIQQKYSQKRTEQTDKEVEAAAKMYEQSVKQTTNASAAALSTLSGLLGAYADESEEASKAQKAFAFGSVLLSEAMSIADGAQAMAAAVAGANEAAAAGGPAAPILAAVYTAQMVGQVIAMVASVASTIVQAKQIFAQSDAGKYENGGFIPGTSYTGDKMIAHVNSGELVVPVEGQKRLLEAMNGGLYSGAYEQMAQAVAAGMAAAPAPVVDYQEFTTFESNVATYNEIASI